MVRPRITVRKNGKLGRTTNYDYYAPWGKVFRSFDQVLQAVKHAEDLQAQGIEPGYTAKRGRPKKGEERPNSSRRRKHDAVEAASSSFAVTGSSSAQPLPKRIRAASEEPCFSSSSAPASPSAHTDQEADSQ